MLERLFKSKSEVAVLNVALFTDDLHLREIARRANVSSFEAKRELDNLVFLGILNKEKKGNQLFFSKNKNCSFLQDIINLFEKTEGIVVRISKALVNEKEVHYALIFGSTAQNKTSEKSDVDVLVIGNIDENEISSVFFEIQKKVKREINFILWSDVDFSKKLKQKSTFLKNIAENSYTWIRGDKDEFSRVIKQTYG